MNQAALSPGWKTRLMLAGFDGQITGHGDLLMARAPLSPGYDRGNFLRCGRLPGEAGFGPERRRFKEAIGICRQLGFGQHDTLWMLERRAPEDVATP